MIYGYARVSTPTQKKDGNSLPEQAETILSKYPGAEIISDALSGAIERPAFMALLEKAVDGDTIVVTKLDRFCRATKEGLDYADRLMQKGASVHILNYGLIENTPTGRLLITQLLAFAEFERAMIRERTMAGRAYKRANDKSYREGRRAKEYPDFQKYQKMKKDSLITVVEACAEMGISRSQWYKLEKQSNPPSSKSTDYSVRPTLTGSVDTVIVSRPV